MGHESNRKFVGDLSARTWALILFGGALAAVLIAAGGALAANKDLIVSVTASPNAMDNSTVDFNVTATNAGNSTAGPVTVQLYIDGIGVGPLLNYGNIGANSSDWQAENTTMFCGWHTINATVDPSDQVPEDNETNNNFTFLLKVGPYVNFTWALSGPLGDNNLSLNASQSHGCEPLTFDWTLDSIAKSGVAVDYNPPAGTLPLTLVATPADVTLATTITTSIVVPNLEPSLTVTLANATIKTLTPLQLSIDAVDQDGAIDSYFVEFGDGNTTFSLGAVASYLYHRSGTFTVHVRVTDNLGATNETNVTVTVANQAPSVNLAYDFWVANVGDSVPFDASGSSDPEGGGLTYTWEFGDGSTGSGPTVNHTFTAPGSYKVNVTVTDSTGASTTRTETVTILGGSTGGPDIVLWGSLLLLIILALIVTLYLLSRRRKDEGPKPPVPPQDSSGKPPSG